MNGSSRGGPRLAAALVLALLAVACGQGDRDEDFSRLSLERRLASLDRHDESVIGPGERPVGRFQRVLKRLQEAYPGTPREVFAEQGVRGYQSLLDDGKFESLHDLMNATLLAARGRPTSTPYSEAVTRYVASRRSGLTSEQAIEALAASLAPAGGVRGGIPATPGR